MKKVKGSPSAWESGALGTNPDTVRLAGRAHEDALDAALGMKAVSIRMPVKLIAAYKLIASHHGVGYQPLMRDILSRWVKHGMLEVMSDMEELAAQAEQRLSTMESGEPERKVA